MTTEPLVLSTAEARLVLALRKMPDGWCRELGMCTVAEGRDAEGNSGWGDEVYFAFLDLAGERGDKVT